MTTLATDLTQAPLGKKTPYISTYTPSLLFPIARSVKREEIGITDKLPFSGVDIWTAFELSWLNAKGKPEVAIGEFSLPCESPNLIESKSIKLYFNSLNQTKFANVNDVQQTIIKDFSNAARATIDFNIVRLNDYPRERLPHFAGICLDDLDIAIDQYQPHPQYLHCDDANDEIVTETLYSDLLKSNCLMTGQPDWGSIQIHYHGRKINHEDLLKYIISLREHNEFNEQCVERIFVNIMERCQPEKLTVFGRYTRRGGIDTNPFRSNFETAPNNVLLCRQ